MRKSDKASFTSRGNLQAQFRREEATSTTMNIKSFRRQRAQCSMLELVPANNNAPYKAINVVTRSYRYHDSRDTVPSKKFSRVDLKSSINLLIISTNKGIFSSL